MTKDIKKSIIALGISIFLFALSLFLLHTFNTLANSSTIIRVVIAIFAVSSLVIGFVSFYFYV